MLLTSKSTRTEELIQIEVRAIATGGDSVGQVVSQDSGAEDLLGITAFIPYAVPGELIEAAVTQRKERFLRAELRSVLRAAEERVEPRCEYFGRCGGCDFQHIGYQRQLAEKQDMIISAMRAAQFGERELELVQKIVPSDNPFGYRQRITLHINQRGKVGFYRAGSRDLIEVKHCEIADSGISAVIDGISRLGEALANQVSSIRLVADSQGVIAVLETPYDMAAGQARELLRRCAAVVPNSSLQHDGTEIAGVGRTQFSESAAGSDAVRLPAAAFSQVNTGVNRKLVSRVVEKVSEQQSSKEILDLYAGAGNFSLPIASRLGASKITAVEYDAELVKSGRENAARLELDRRLSFQKARVEDYLQKHRAPEGCAVIADPPRSGLGAVVRQLNGAEYLLFIACHMPSFLRDAKALKAGGWELVSIEPYDMFPQTAHVEILGEFRRTARRYS